MYPYKHLNHACEYYMGDLAARVVAESGRPEDRFHLGKLILRSLRDAPDHILQIDGATGESETNKSVLERSVRCARAFKKLGVGHGDIIMTLAPNHLDLAIAYYAVLFTGVTIAPVDQNLGKKELHDFVVNDKPKLVFCQSEKAEDIRWALDQAKVHAKIVTFDKSSEEGVDCFKNILEKFRDSAFEDFKASDFDPEETVAVLMCTSGTTGLPKQAMLTHKSFAVSNYGLWTRYTKYPTPTKIALLVSPLHWVTAVIYFNATALLRFTRLQSSRPVDQDHAYELFNTYKPTFWLSSPTLLASLIKPRSGEPMDVSSLDTLMIGGSAVSSTLLSEMKKSAPGAYIMNGFGMSEVAGLTFLWDNSPLKSVGGIAPHLQYRLVDPDTDKFILEPNVPGELWVTGVGLFKGYYGRPEATAEAFVKDADGITWFKTGDMFYRDEHWNFYFVDRLKLLLKYKNFQVSPAEIQNVIKSHPAVLDVAVTSVPDYECGDLPVACVVRRPGHRVTAQEIKDLVKDSLSDMKQLRGGVLFLDSLPMTPSTKIDYRRLKDMVLHMNRE